MQNSETKISAPDELDQNLSGEVSEVPETVQEFAAEQNSIAENEQEQLPDGGALEIRDGEMPGLSPGEIYSDFKKTDETHGQLYLHNLGDRLDLAILNQRPGENPFMSVDLANAPASGINDRNEPNDSLSQKNPEKLKSTLEDFQNILEALVENGRAVWEQNGQNGELQGFTLFVLREDGHVDSAFWQAQNKEVYSEEQTNLTPDHSSPTFEHNAQQQTPVEISEPEPAEVVHPVELNQSKPTIAEKSVKDFNEAVQENTLREPRTDQEIFDNSDSNIAENSQIVFEGLEIEAEQAFTEQLKMENPRVYMTAREERVLSEYISVQNEFKRVETQAKEKNYSTGSTAEVIKTQASVELSTDQNDHSRTIKLPAVRQNSEFHYEFIELNKRFAETAGISIELNQVSVDNSVQSSTAKTITNVAENKLSTSPEKLQTNFQSETTEIRNNPFEDFVPTNTNKIDSPALKHRVDFKPPIYSRLKSKNRTEAETSGNFTKLINSLNKIEPQTIFKSERVETALVKQNLKHESKNNSPLSKDSEKNLNRQFKINTLNKQSPVENRQINSIRGSKEALQKKSGAEPLKPSAFSHSDAKQSHPTFLPFLQRKTEQWIAMPVSETAVISENKNFQEQINKLQAEIQVLSALREFTKRNGFYPGSNSAADDYITTDDQLLPLKKENEIAA